MQLILSYFDQKLGPSAIEMLPQEFNNEFKKEIYQVMDTETSNGFFVFDNHLINSANFIFEIKSEWTRGESERLMLTLLIDKNIKDFKSFTPILKKYANRIKTSPNIYKSLYIDDVKKIDAEIEIKSKELHLIAENCYKDCEKQEKQLRALNIYILGLNHVGKSSIIRQLNKEEFNPNIKPTLGKEVIRVVVENTSMDILDVGENKSIEELWKENPNPPEAIVFVLDFSAGKEHYTQSNEEFKKVMKFFFGKNTEHTLPKTTPVLILASKVDNVKNVDKQFLEKLLNPKIYGINYRLGYVSAKMEEGVYDNFRWIIQEFLKYI